MQMFFSQTFTSQPPSCPPDSVRRDQGFTWPIRRPHGPTRRARLAASDNMETCQLRSDHSGHSLLASPLHRKWKKGSMRAEQTTFRSAYQCGPFSLGRFSAFQTHCSLEVGGGLHSVSVPIKITFTPSRCCRIICQ